MAAQDQSIFEDEGAGYLVSVSDIMAGLLFIFIITLVAFVIHFQSAAQETQRLAEQKRKEEQVLREQTRVKSLLIDRLTNNRAVRDQLLSDIERELALKGVTVKVDMNHGVLRLTEDTVRFASAKADLEEHPRRNLELIADVLSDLLPCYANGDAPDKTCDPRTAGKLEAVFIEGHTDNVPLRSPAWTNWDLSAKRAISTYQHMFQHSSTLGLLKNLNGEPLFSVAGYADQRPLFVHASPTDDQRNRRIDMRFIMMPPSSKDAAIVQQVHDHGVR